MDVTNLIAESAAVEYEVAKVNCPENDFNKMTITLEHEKMSAVKAVVACEKNKEGWLINMALDPIKSNHIITMGATTILTNTVEQFVKIFILNTEKKLGG